MRRAVPWVGTILVATAIDLAARFTEDFRLERVLRIEAVLFFAVGGVFAALLRHPPRATGWLRLVQLTLTASFLLAGVRAALWSVGLPVPVANMAVLILATLAAMIAWVRRRRGMSANH